MRDRLPPPPEPASLSPNSRPRLVAGRDVAARASRAPETSASRSSDQELLTRVRYHDADALRTLYSRHQGPVFRFALALCEREDKAALITQKSFMHLLLKLPRPSPAAIGIGCELLRTARSLLRTEVAQTLVEGNDFVTSERFPQRCIEDVAPLLGATRGRTRTALGVGLWRLPADYREALVLTGMLGLTAAEAGMVLECSAQTVRARLCRARGLLIKELCGVLACEPGAS